MHRQNSGEFHKVELTETDLLRWQLGYGSNLRVLMLLMALLDVATKLEIGILNPFLCRQGVASLS